MTWNSNVAQPSKDHQNTSMPFISMIALGWCETLIQQSIMIMGLDLWRTNLSRDRIHDNTTGCKFVTVLANNHGAFPCMFCTHVMYVRYSCNPTLWIHELSDHSSDFGWQNSKWKVRDWTERSCHIYRRQHLAHVFGLFSPAVVVWPLMMLPSQAWCRAIWRGMVGIFRPDELGIAFCLVSGGWSTTSRPFIPYNTTFISRL